MVLTWVSVGAEKTACTKHLFGLSPSPWRRVRGSISRAS